LYNESRRNAVMRGLNRMAQDERDRRLSPTAQRLKGALFAYLGPRLAFDHEMPDLEPVLEGVDRGNVRGRRKLIADRLRKAMRGRTARDADLSDLECLLEALEELDEVEDHEIEADPSHEPESDPFREPGEDRRRRMAGDDPEPFPGRPQTGGRMDALPGEHNSDVRFPHPGEPAAEGPMGRGAMGEDRLPHQRGRAHDARPNSFAARFGFAVKHTRPDDGTAKME
jgi:hypothetical protein